MVIDANVYWFPEALFTDEALRERFFMDVPRDRKSVCRERV